MSMSQKLAINGGKPASEKKIQIAKPVFSEDTIEEVAEVLRSGYVRQGPKTELFEKKFAERTGARHAYAVSSGTAALHVSYLSCIKPGDEVIVPSFTFIATASMVFYSNARPVFVDVDPETYLIDAEDVKEKITKKTKAIAPVHLFGNIAEMDALKDIAEDKNLLIINDAAQAHGSEYRGKDIGAFDDLTCYSFYPTKTMITGEVGMVTTTDPALHKRGCLLRSHGVEGKYNHVILGLNYRMTDMAAVIGLNQLQHLDEFLEKRRKLGKTFSERISKIDGIRPQIIRKNVNPSYSYFTVTMDPSMFKCTRDQFVQALQAENIDSAVHYPIPLTKQPAIMELMKPSSTPISEKLSKTVFSLPMHPYLSGNDIENIIEGLEKVATYYSK